MRSGAALLPRVSGQILGRAMGRQHSRAGSSPRRGELVSDRLVRFPEGREIISIQLVRLDT